MFDVQKTLFIEIDQAVKLAKLAKQHVNTVSEAAGSSSTDDDQMRFVYMLDMVNDIKNSKQRINKEGEVTEELKKWLNTVLGMCVDHV
jgi:hypothetical protein